MAGRHSIKPFLVFFIFSILFILSMFNLVSNAVIAPNLIQDLGLNANSLGILGGAYFCSFALLQIPIGPMLDRIGPRSVITFCLMIGVFVSFLFAFGNSFTTALVGRILIGVGMAPVLVGILKVFNLQSNMLCQIGPSWKEYLHKDFSITEGGIENVSFQKGLDIPCVSLST
jgi:MFS family permease